MCLAAILDALGAVIRALSQLLTSVEESVHVLTFQHVLFILCDLRNPSEVVFVLFLWVSADLMSWVWVVSYFFGKLGVRTPNHTSPGIAASLL